MAVAKGAQKNKNKFFALTLPFSYGDFVLYRGKNLYTINEGNVIDSFQEFLSDIETITYSSYLCELIDIALTEEESHRELFRLFVTAFYLIKNEVGDMETIIRAFEIKLLYMTGYWINFEDYNVTVASKNAINNLFKFPIEKVYRINLPAQVKLELSKLLTDVIGGSYSRKPKSLSILNNLKE